MNGKSKPGRPHLADPRTHRYNFKLNEEENIRFCRMLAEALDWNTTAAGLSSKESSPKSFAWCVSTRPWADM